MASEGRQIDGDILQGKADVLRAQQEGLGTDGADDAPGRPAADAVPDAVPTSATDTPSPSQAVENRGKPLPPALRPLGAPIPHRPVSPEGVPSSEQAQATTGCPEQTTTPSPTASSPQEDTGPADDSETIDPEEQDLARRIRAALERVGQAEHAEQQEPMSAPTPPPDANQPPTEGPPCPTSESVAADSSGTSIPQLDLAEQILAEQRRMVAQRRQRSGPGGTSAAAPRGIRHVVDSIRGDAGRQRPEPTDGQAPVTGSPVGVPVSDQAPTPRESQIARIVAADIARLYRQA